MRLELFLIDCVLFLDLLRDRLQVIFGLLRGFRQKTPSTNIRRTEFLWPEKDPKETPQIYRRMLSFLQAN